MNTSITSATDGQKKQIKRFAEDAVDRAIAEGILDKNGIQRLIERGDDFQAHIINSICELSMSQFAGEEMGSGTLYPIGYGATYESRLLHALFGEKLTCVIKGITKQTKILRQLFPDIGFADEKLAEQSPPASAEGWFAIPRWEAIAETYNEAVEKVMKLIAMQQKDDDFLRHSDYGRDGVEYDRNNRLEEQHLRQHERTTKMLEALAEQQKGYDILVVAAQFGLRHRGRSVRRARVVFTPNEFGLGTFEIGCMLLTHPRRLVNDDDLNIDCAGSEYSDRGDDDFSCVPYFGISDGEIWYGSYPDDDARSESGSASGFLPSC